MLTSEDRKLLQDFNRNVSWLKQRELKDTKNWVKVSTITELTGWDRERLRRARENGEIVWKKENGMWYDPSSINEIHIKKKIA